MKSGLKFFILSFFSNRVSREVGKHGCFSMTLSIVLALVIVFFGIILGDTIPFDYHYRHSEAFQTLIHNAFANSDENLNVVLTVANGSISSFPDVVDTIADPEDEKHYKTGNYHLIVDTRDTNAMFDDFEAYCVSKDERNLRVTYEEYLVFSEAVKENYEFKIEYSGKELIFTEEKVATYTEYLEGLKDDSEKKEYYERYILLNKESENYVRDLYQLYIDGYYPSLIEYESSGSAPTIRNYYFHEYVENRKLTTYLFVFDDILVGSFITDRNVPISFYGFVQSGDYETDGTVASIDRLIASSFLRSTKLSVYVYLINYFSGVFYFVAILVVSGALLYCLLNLANKKNAYRFKDALILVGNYFLMDSVLTFSITLFAGYFLPRGSFFIYTFLIFFLILLVRLGVLVLGEYMTEKKNKEGKR